MNKKRTVILKRKCIVLAITALSFSGVANAQWSVVNVNDSHYFGLKGVFTTAMANMFNSLRAAIDGNTAIIDIARRQNAQDTYDRDIRQRVALGQANIAQYLMEKVPTLEACAAVSAKSGMSGGISQSGAGAGSASGINAVNSAKELTRVVEKLALPMKRKASLGTCSPADVASNFAGCSPAAAKANGIKNDPSEFGGSNLIPSSDITYLAIKGNTSNQLKSSPSTQELANLTIPKDGTAYDVALQYITNATMYAAPNALTPDQAADKRSTIYQPMYNNVMIKLYAAQQAYNDIVASRIELPIEKDSFALENWKRDGYLYNQIMGMKMPDQPSLMDYITSTAMIDLLGVRVQDIPTDEVGYLREINEKIKLNNVIAVKSLQQQENTNILLAQILTQMVTPVNTRDLEIEYDAIDSYIPKVTPKTDPDKE